MLLGCSVDAGEHAKGASPGYCATCDVRADAICASLEPAALVDLSKLGRRVRVNAGQTLLWEGDEAALVGNVLSGILKLSTMTGDGREQIVGMVFPADFIGRPFGKDSHQTVTALTDAVVCVFRRTPFDDFARAHGDIGEALLRRTLDDLDRARRWMLLLGRMSATERVASLLLELNSRLDDSDGEGGVIPLPLSRQQMGDLLGLTIETISRTIKKFERLGLIALPGARLLAVRNEQELRRIAAG
jgi:CRP/FNR family transcriptional regulator